MSTVVEPKRRGTPGPAPEEDRPGIRLLLRLPDLQAPAHEAAKPAVAHSTRTSEEGEPPQEAATEISTQKTRRRTLAEAAGVLIPVFAEKLETLRAPAAAVRRRWKWIAALGAAVLITAGSFVAGERLLTGDSATSDESAARRGAIPEAELSIEIPGFEMEESWNSQPPPAWPEDAESAFAQGSAGSDEDFAPWFQSSGDGAAARPSREGSGRDFIPPGAQIGSAPPQERQIPGQASYGEEQIVSDSESTRYPQTDPAKYLYPPGLPPVRMASEPAAGRPWSPR